MKKLFLFFAPFCFPLFSYSQIICNPNGNVVLYSNYDGGVLNINVDVNIPNLKIGVVSYEMVTVNLTGPFVNNVTEVRFAGYTTTTHQHCANSPLVTSITGAPVGTDTLVFMPASPVTNPNGYYIIICNTSCDTVTNQGGCNTPDQVAAYFLNTFGGSLRFHQTQYGCWQGVQQLSTGGNCCVGAVTAVPVPFCSFVSSDTSFCEKKCLDFTDLSSNNPTSWQWFFPGADSTTSLLQNPTNICYNSYGSFDVTLVACNANGCDTLTIPGFINAFPLPSIPSISANFDTLFSSTAYAYQWYNASGPIFGAINQYFIYLQNDDYYVVITDSNGCASSSNVIYTAIAEQEGSIFTPAIYPNPSDGNFNMVFNGLFTETVSYEISDVTGRVIIRSAGMASGTLVNIGSAENGMYILRVENEKKYYNVKLMVNHLH